MKFLGTNPMKYVEALHGKNYKILIKKNQNLNKRVLKEDGATAKFYVRPTLFRIEQNTFWLALSHGSITFQNISS